MTIKTRNRFTLAFLIFSILIFAAELSLASIQFFKGNLKFPEVFFSKPTSNLFLLKYRPECVLIGIFLKNIYVIFSTLFILRAFEKTQSSEIFYFLLFLLACLCDSAKILIPLFHISQTYSTTLLIIGNVLLFSRILFPLSLMSTIILYENEHHQNIERNSLLLLVVATFLAAFIPLNTTIIEPHFIVSYGYEKTIKITTVIIQLANILTLIFRNINRNSKQWTTIGIFILSIGIFCFFGNTCILSLALGFFGTCIGTFIFLRALHKFYLWND